MKTLRSQPIKVFKIVDDPEDPSVYEAVEIPPAATTWPAGSSWWLLGDHIAGTPGLTSDVPDSDARVDGPVRGHYRDLRRLERGSLTTVPLLKPPRMARSRQATEAS